MIDTIISEIKEMFGGKIPGGHSSLNEQTSLIGDNSPLDSMALVQL